MNETHSSTPATTPCVAFQPTPNTKRLINATNNKFLPSCKTFSETQRELIKQLLVIKYDWYEFNWPSLVVAVCVCFFFLQTTQWRFSQVQNSVTAQIDPLPSAQLRHLLTLELSVLHSGVCVCVCARVRVHEGCVFVCVRVNVCASLFTERQT